MKTILLPGLDGTGLLFEKLLEEIPSDLNVEIISYESLESVSYTDQAAEISERFKGEDIFIVGESYSGPVAYELCQISEVHVCGVVFLASFISRPSGISRFGTILPLAFLRPNVLSQFLLYVFGFNMTGSLGIVDPVFESLKKSDKRKLKLRLCNIAQLTEPVVKLECPVTYILPSTDLLVSNNSIKFLASMCTNFSQIKVSGGHFIAQSSPTICAKVICDAFSHADTKQATPL